MVGVNHLMCVRQNMCRRCVPIVKIMERVVRPDVLNADEFVK